MLIELIQLSERMKFTGCEPFVVRPINWVIDLDKHGNFIAISPTVRTVTGKKGAKKEVRGKQYSRPTSFYVKFDNKGKMIATTGGGNVPTLLGIGRLVEFFGQEFQKDKAVVKVSSEKDKTRRENFIALHQRLAASLPENELARAVCAFLASNPELKPKTFFPKEDNAETTKKSGQDDSETQLVKLNEEYLTFRVSGKLLIQNQAFVSWWTSYYGEQRRPVLETLPLGTDLLSTVEHPGRLTKIFPHIAGIPNGGGYCPLASFYTEPSQSYGLGSMTTPMLLENAEKAAAALNWLLREETAHLRLGSDLVAAFWAVDLSKPEKKPKVLPFASLLLADPLQVRDFFRSPSKGIYQDVETASFYAVILSSPQSRVTVRNWHTSTLAEADRHLRAYFDGIRLTDDEDSEFYALPVWLLAKVTIQPSKKGDKAKPQPDTYSSLFETALFGAPLPYKLLSKVLQRQGLELAKGADKKNRTEFDKRLGARTALIKLFFKITKGVDMSPDKHSIETDAAYLCGRLLAMLDRIHTEAHKGSGGTNSTPANRVYGAASTTPALIFPQLCKLARHHLNKLGGGMARNLEFGVRKENRTDGASEDFAGLSNIVARLLQTPEQQFPRTFTLEEQGRFAIGFYYERSLSIPRTSKPKGSDSNETKGDDNNER